MTLIRIPRHLRSVTISHHASTGVSCHHSIRCRQAMGSRSMARMTTSNTGTATRAESEEGSVRQTFGQPLPHTHPWLFPQDEHLATQFSQATRMRSSDPDQGPFLTPYITAAEYHDRRMRLLEMEEINVGDVIIVKSADKAFISGEVFHPFRQSASFFYLTGLQESESFVIIQKVQPCSRASSGALTSSEELTSSRRCYKMTLFLAPKDAYEECWHGARTGLDGAIKYFGADEAFPSNDPTVLSQHLDNLLAGSSFTSSNKVITDINLDQLTAGRSGQGMLSFLKNKLRPAKVRPLSPLLDKIRVHKTAIELRALRQAGRIAGNAQSSVMRFVAERIRNGIFTTEQHIAAHFAYQCSLNGAEDVAYVPVVAAGRNALGIHYTANNDQVHPSDMILLDAGCIHGNYLSDVTRTFPASGIFSGPQADLYNAVLSAQKSTLSQCTQKQGFSLNALQRHCIHALTQELKQIGFHNISAHTVERQLYPHFIGHHLGLDLHETARRDRPLESSNVITIEPGIYVPPSPEFPRAFHNMGIRIEDDVAVHDDNFTILSVEAPKEIVDIEALCAA